MKSGRPEVVSSSIHSVSFGFYTREEVHSISVKKIDTWTCYDNDQNPIPHGLCDTDLGPSEKEERCTTCHLNYTHCPGHFGHIDLPLPVYNPLLFNHLYRILRLACFNCHRFRHPRKLIKAYETKLKLLVEGKLAEAEAIDINLANQPLLDLGSEDEEVNEDERKKFMHENEAKKQKHEMKVTNNVGDLGDLNRSELTSHCVGLKNQLIDKFMHDVLKTTCYNCGAVNPSLKRESRYLIAKMPLSLKHLDSNKKNKIKFLNVLKTESSNGGETQPEMEEDRDAEEFLGASTALDEDFSKKTFISPLEAKKHVQLLNQNEKVLFDLIWAQHEILNKFRGKCAGEKNYIKFFIESLLVSPNRFRQNTKSHGLVVQHPQNIMLEKILQKIDSFLTLGRKKEDMQLITRAWISIQENINIYMDSTLAQGYRRDIPPGLCQRLEKKEGLFRMHMMGKRVNYSCRSVISPDPYIQVNEIGIPPYFATRLTFPEPVTHFNVEKLRQLVINGPNEHPGAVHIEDETGKIISLRNANLFKRKALAKTLLSSPSATSDAFSSDARSFKLASKIVYRHLMDGDIVLVNRQPTLHRPGIMAHRVKILKGEKTLRLHYANCNVYNADFDGDEMNVHFPQDFIARSEAYNIVNADDQYIIPTSGNPVRGLIQDHIVSAALLTMPDKFFTREEYHQLLYSAFLPELTKNGIPVESMQGEGLDGDKRRKCYSVIENDFFTLPPTIIKPERMWTGKQIIASLLFSLTRGNKPVNFSSNCKIPANYWGENTLSSSESKFVVKDNEIMTGVMDKAQFGNFGLVHNFQELYGCDVAGKLLSSLSRLLTSFLQMNGYTCGIDDIMLKQDADKFRKKILSNLNEVGLKASASFIGKEEDVDKLTEEEIRKEVERKVRKGKENSKVLWDRNMTSALSRITTQATNHSLPAGEFKPFPYNCMSLMTISGAKGSMVNFNQISVLLGQQELEGKRVPLMASGKSLPSFPPFSSHPRAGGYICNRFLSGLRPQEYYFHCMAGRDGLVDTAVKTSNSGYLQRCLVKTLEGLRTHYDYTVRDSDGSIVQFRYGGDALDSTKISHLNNFTFFQKNADQFSISLGQEEADRNFSDSTYSMLLQSLNDYKSTKGIEVSIDSKKLKKNKEIKPDVGHIYEHLNFVKKKHTVLMDELNPGNTLGIISEGFQDKLVKFLTGEGKGIGWERKAKLMKMMEIKYMRSLVQPGDPVGIIAAQSVGEPSTQMTLNTFHFAGRGEANVTLGIPRLREILMTASKNIATPVIDCPLLPGKTRADGERIASQLQLITLSELIKVIQIKEFFDVSKSDETSVRVLLRVELYPLHQYPSHLKFKFSEFKNAILNTFFPLLEKNIMNFFGKKLSNSFGVTSEKRNGKKNEGEDEEMDDLMNEKPEKEFEEDMDEGVEEELGEGADAEKWRKQSNDEMGYEDEAVEDSEEEREDEDEEEEAEEGENGEVEEREGEESLLQRSRNVENSPGEPKSAKRKYRKSRENEGDDEEEELGVIEDDDTYNAKKREGKEATEYAKKMETKEEAQKVKFGDQWCEIELAYGLNSTTVMVQELAERIAKKTKVRSTEGINKCTVLDPLTRNSAPRLQVEGHNVQKLWEHGDVLDLNQLTTNHIYIMWKKYGVEVARALIVQEVKNVFGMYGINVLPRHLELIADYMTHHGGYRPCNRIGMQTSSSPFQRMSFESATSFLKKSALHGDHDPLISPSSRIVMGQVVDIGSGVFDLMQNI